MARPLSGIISLSGLTQSKLFVSAAIVESYRTWIDVTKMT